MRPFLSIAACSLIAAPGAAMAQPLALTEPPPAGALAPTPTLAPTEPAPDAVTVPPPPVVQGGAAPPDLEPPTTVPPVIVAKEDKGGAAKTVVGTTAFGVAGGLAGAAVAGPVGKFAGGFIFKRVAQSLFGDKDKTPELKVIPQTPAAADTAMPASDRVMDAASLDATRIADER
ncbi:hypothetical protein [Phenylobacterium sp.]|uniref:hypothetical protein n=1 Tax=Phenylobacterium sp. TaxID=1871053 RepID=UPI003D2B4185